MNFRGEKRSNQTHESKTDPDARLARKSAGREAKLSYSGNLLVENRHGLIVSSAVWEATGTAERDAWAAARPEEKIRLQMFCCTGFRKLELAFLEWGDVDLENGTVTLSPKPGWKPKDKESRTVVLPDFMVTALREYRKTHPGQLVFPSATGLVACRNQLLYMLKDVAKRAGVGGRVDLHKFRSTYASYLNRSGEISMEEIAARLGHADVATTKAYLERLQHTTDRARRQSNAALAQFG